MNTKRPIEIDPAECSDYPGVCLACGELADSCEPDARGYECECCGAHKVYGIAEAILMGAAVPAPGCEYEDFMAFC